MGDRAAKNALLAEFAAVGRALANPGRLELLDLLAQGPRSVEELAGAAAMGISTCSAHLHSLREAGLVESVRDGKRVVNFLTDDDVAQLLLSLRSVALRHRPATDRARRAYLGPEDTEAVTRAELLDRARAGDLVIVDVRPGNEFAAGHLPGAVNIPHGELAARIAELSAARERDIVVYCRTGVRSGQALEVLDKAGFKRLFHLKGDYTRWSEEKRPVVATQ
jgi:rhodanese-related sulfurtransferase